MPNINTRNKYFDEKIYLTGTDNAANYDIVVDEKGCSSFKEDGVLCDKCFNSALLEKMQDFGSLERLDFINYQLNKYKDPLDWLKRMKALLYDNEDEFRSFNYKIYLEFQQIIDAGIRQLNEPKNQTKRSENKNNGDFVNVDRIEELTSLTSDKFDLKKLIRYCEEINICYQSEAYLAVAMLTRALIDHIPPLFGASDFQNAYGQNGTRSFKEHMTHLDKSLRKIADNYLHSHIRKTETLPNNTQVNFSQDIDVLIAEIIRILK
jgi:hypothetical protein